MADEPITRHEIPYRRLFPWLRLFRSIGVASDAKALMLAALGLVLLHAGWEGLDRLFTGSTEVTPEVLPAGRWPVLVHWADEVRAGAATEVAARGVEWETLSRWLGSAAWRL